MNGNAILIANRGEIAIRIALAAADLGLASVAVFAEDDAESPHCRSADRAVALKGKGPAAYLDGAGLIAAARATGCAAIHPGYGFLSESAAFARAVGEAGLVFIGPSPATLERLGDKVTARALAESLGLPVPRGSSGRLADEGAARAFLADLGGTAMMLKAASGGGGRGMRVVHDAAEVASAFQQCAAEAEKAFGDGGLFAEEFIAHARHVEVQVLGDGQGGLVHLFERDCSLQRQHQKLVEIAPAPGLPADTAKAMREAALRMAGDVGYLGLGTFEFLVARGGRDFRFIEVNPRLQVEHTITEELTGVDLVVAQIRVCLGDSLAALGLGQERIEARPGHVVQLRVNMELMGPDGRAVPTEGLLARYAPPAGPGIRVDGFGEAGYRTNPRYDTLLAKLVVACPAPDLGAALARTRRALGRFTIEGVETNAPFLDALLAHPELCAETLETGFVAAHLPALLAAIAPAKASAATPSERLPAGTFACRAPVSGVLATWEAAPGDVVAAGRSVALIEAMKMEIPASAEASGRVLELWKAAGDTVTAGEIIALLEEAEVDGQGDSAAQEDPAAIRPELAELLARRALIADEGRPEAVARRRGQGPGKLTAREMLARLFDEGPISEYGAHTVAAQRRRRNEEELLRMSPADGLIAQQGRVGARDTVALAYDYSVLAGTQGINGHHKTDRVLQVAERLGTPVVVLAEGGGGRPGDTDHNGATGLDSPTFARFAALNGKVPLVAVVTGRCFAGNAALAGCCDVLIATEDSNIGMAGPAMIEGGGLGRFPPEAIGPARAQWRGGVVDLLAPDDGAAIDLARRYLGYFGPPAQDWQAPDQGALRALVPANRLRAYDPRPIFDILPDAGSFLELRAGFAPGLITGLARIEGLAVGVLANNPLVLGGAVDAPCADKAARFMQLCEAFGLPVLALVDTPGFMVGPEAEETALVRHVSRMFVAGAGLSVPVVSVVLRKAYGLGAMAMAGGSLHAPLLSLSWPTGEFGGMGLEGAVRLAYRAELAAAPDEEARRALFEQYLGEMYARGKALSIASHREIDDVIDPAETRARVAAALAAVPARAPSGGRVDTW